MVQQRFPGQELEAVRVGRALRLDEEAATAPDRSSGALERATGEAKPLQQHAPESRPVGLLSARVLQELLDVATRGSTRGCTPAQTFAETNLGLGGQPPHAGKLGATTAQASSLRLTPACASRLARDAGGGQAPAAEQRQAAGHPAAGEGAQPLQRQVRCMRPRCPVPAVLCHPVVLVRRSLSMRTRHLVRSFNAVGTQSAVLAGFAMTSFAEIDLPHNAFYAQKVRRRPRRAATARTADRARLPSACRPAYTSSSPSRFAPT